MKLKYQDLESMDEIDETHGPHVRDNGVILFSDGTRIEEFSKLKMPPPDDEFELAKLKLRFWEIESEKADEQFQNFKDYLAGSGRREDAWATLYTHEMQVAHLKTLQVAAKRVRAKHAKARKAVEESRPFWLDARDEQEIEHAQRQQEFRDTIDGINI
jgi:hypothetical protein